MNGSTIPVQVPTRGTESICIVALPVLRRGQPDGGESCIVLESGPIRSLVAKLPQHLSLAVHEFRAASNDRCEQGYRRVCAKLLPDVVTPEVHQNSRSYMCVSVSEFSGPTTVSLQPTTFRWVVTRITATCK